TGRLVAPARAELWAAVAAAARPSELPAVERPRGGGRTAASPAAADRRNGGAGAAAGRGAARHRRCAGSDAIRPAAGPRFAAQCAAAGEYGTAAERRGGR